jgi:hypothetical protein
MVGHVGQPRQDVFQVSVRIQAAPAAAFDDGVNDRAAFPRFGGPDEEPVFLAQGGGTDGVFYAELGITFSTKLLSISIRPSLRKTANVLQTPSA